MKNQAVPYIGTEIAKVRRLDHFVRENGLDVGLIKMDVEGAERLVLEGALDTIRTMPPTLLISIYHNAEDFFGIKPFLESLGLGYRFKVRHPAIGTVLTESDTGIPWAEVIAVVNICLSSLDRVGVMTYIYAC